MKRILYLLAAIIAAQCALQAQSNIKPGDSYAWAGNIGWAELIPNRPAPLDGVQVGSTFLSGYAWSDSTGWINFGSGTPADGVNYSNTDGSDFGVNLDAAGNLSGLAWSPNLGWINFGWATVINPNRPRIDVVTGAFDGYAWSESTGWITLSTGLLKTDFAFPPLSSNADLAGLILGTGNLSPVFDPAVTTYTSDAVYGTSSVVAIPTQAHAGASIKVNGQTVVSGTASEMVPLTGSSTPLSIEVTAQDGLTTKTYHVSVSILNANQLSLASSFFTVFSTPAATTVDVVINRANSLTGTVSCELSTTDGSAISPGDYAVQNATTVTFADGVTQQHVFIPISANAALSSGKSFTVSLANASIGSSLKAPTTAQIVILPPGMDNVKPVVTLSTPASAATLVDTDPISISGSATDNIGVAKVQVSLDGITYQDATLAAPNATSTTYTTTITPKAGANVLRARALDQKGNISLLITRGFTHLRTLTVAISGPLNSGTVSSGFVPTSSRQSGKSYSILATPKPGFVFDGWIVTDMSAAGVTPAQTELPSLTFIMQPGLTLVAKFIENPFTSAVTGNYSGLIMPSDVLPVGGTVANNSTVGLCTATLTSTGALTGKVFIDGFSLPFTAKCDNTGVARFGVTREVSTPLPRTGKSPLLLTLYADLVTGSMQIGGSVIEVFQAGGSAVSIIRADRHAYNGSTSKVPAEYVKSYTARFKPRDSQGEGFTSKDYPQGNGYLTFSVANNGVVTMIGKLADDVPVSMSGNLSQFNQWPIFQSLHSNRGCIAANAVLDDSQADTDATAMDMLWFCPALNMQWYPRGWSEGIFVDMLASKYTPPPASVFPGLPASNPTYGNTDLVFTQGLLTGTVIKRVNMTPTNVATRAPALDTSVSFIPTFTSGLIGGLFRHTDNTMTKWQGVLMQKGANRGGHGYFLSTRPSITDFKGESGAMSWRVVQQ